MLVVSLFCDELKWSTQILQKCNKLITYVMTNITLNLISCKFILVPFSIISAGRSYGRDRSPQG